MLNFSNVESLSSDKFTQSNLHNLLFVSLFSFAFSMCLFVKFNLTSFKPFDLLLHRLKHVSAPFVEFLYFDLVQMETRSALLISALIE